MFSFIIMCPTCGESVELTYCLERVSAGNKQQRCRNFLLLLKNWLAGRCRTGVAVEARAPSTEQILATARSAHYARSSCNLTFYRAPTSSLSRIIRLSVEMLNRTVVFFYAVQIFQ